MRSLYLFLRLCPLFYYVKPTRDTPTLLLSFKSTKKICSACRIFYAKEKIKASHTSCEAFLVVALPLRSLYLFLRILLLSYLLFEAFFCEGKNKSLLYLLKVPRRFAPNKRCALFKSSWYFKYQE